MTNEIWLSIEDVCSLSNEKIETARRKCKSGIYTSKFEKEGKFKKYSILLAKINPKKIKAFLRVKNILFFSFLIFLQNLVGKGRFNSL